MRSFPHSGFTLIELMISITILSSVMMVVAMSLDSATKLTDRVSRQVDINNRSKGSLISIIGTRSMVVIPHPMVESCGALANLTGPFFRNNQSSAASAQDRLRFTRREPIWKPTRKESTGPSQNQLLASR